MSANKYINSIAIFQGNQGKYYIVDGYKYDIHFPLAWAFDHHNFEPYYDKDTNQTYINGTGPKECGNCLTYGTLNSVFVGYCSNCLRDAYNNKRGDHSVAPGIPINWLGDCYLWKQYPYMDGVKISEIGDKIIEDEDTIIALSSSDNECEISDEDILQREEEEERYEIKLE